MTKQVPIDVEVLREEIRKTYTEVATDPDQEFIFPTGRAWAPSSAIPSLSSRACPTPRSRASPAWPTTGRSGGSTPGRWSSTSAAVQAPTC